MWYVIQTVTGKEDELLTFVRKILKKKLYTDCFVIKAEWMKRLGGKWLVQVRPLFPGYVFVDTEKPESLFFELKNIPQFSKLLGDGNTEFIAVEKSEKEFLEILTEDRNRKKISEDFIKVNKWIVRRSLVEADKFGKVLKIEGPLRHFESQMRQINYHKRYAVIDIDLFHKSQTVILGIRLNKDLVLGEADVPEKNKENT